MIQEAFNRLDGYCKRFNYSGWDLFDGLNSKSFCNSPLNRSLFFRLAWIQFFKISPINFRGLAKVPKGINPKGHGLFSRGLISLGRIDEAEKLLDEISALKSSGFSGMCWGYNFSWQAKAFYVPAGKPNAIVTIFIANAFLDHFEKTSNSEAIKIARKCCDFILENLIIYEDKNSLCFGYIPGERARVHNVNMLAAALLGRVYHHTKEQQLRDKSLKAMSYSMAALPSKSFWPYGELPHHRFIDNFHTGFNLVALKDWMQYTGDRRWEDTLKITYERFLNTFFLNDGRPKYYDDKLYPIDIHCSAQGIITCLNLKNISTKSLNMAKKIAEWAIKNMQAKDGYFYYQKRKWYTNRIPYMRWSQAWMFYALALYLETMGTYEHKKN